MGRVIQGAGAISAAVTALAADLTREQHRTKVMAMIGGSIALVFAFSMVAAPVLYGLIGMPGIFLITGALSVLAIGVVLKVVPDAPPAVKAEGDASFGRVLKDGRLGRLNFGVFALHVMHGSSASSHSRLAALALAALGVVYGDIGTSPLYAMTASRSSRQLMGRSSPLPRRFTEASVFSATTMAAPRARAWAR